MTPEADDATSDSSVNQPPPHTNPVLLLNSMSRRSKRLSVERKRLKMEREQLPSENSTILRSVTGCTPMLTTGIGPQSTGNQSWLRSLRQSRSCPPANMPRLTLAVEPNMHTANRSRNRTPRTSTDSLSAGSMSQAGNMTPRERLAVEKHLERAAARSRSTQRSASATPERSTSS